MIERWCTQGRERVVRVSASYFDWLSGSKHMIAAKAMSVDPQQEPHGSSPHHHISRAGSPLPGRPHPMKSPDRRCACGDPPASVVMASGFSPRVRPHVTSAERQCRS